MKKSRLLTYVSEGLAALALAGTIFTGTGYATIHNYKPQQVLEQRVVRKGKIGNLAVLLIDMQDYFLERIAPNEKTKEIPYQIEVLDYCKEKSIPVFVLEYKDCGPTTKVLKDKVDSLEKKVYVTKPNDDGFADTDLAERLKEYKIDTLLLMGVNATACVVSTAYGALNAGFNIMTSKDLIADPPYFHSDEGARWYSTYGVYRDNHKELLDMISKGEVEISVLPDDPGYNPSLEFLKEPKKKGWKNPENNNIHLQESPNNRLEELLGCPHQRIMTNQI